VLMHDGSKVVGRLPDLNLLEPYDIEYTPGLPSDRVCRAGSQRGKPTRS